MEVIVFEADAELSIELKKGFEDRVSWISVSDSETLFRLLNNRIFNHLFISFNALDSFQHHNFAKIASDYPKLTIHIGRNALELLNRSLITASDTDERTRLTTALNSVNNIFLHSDNPQYILSKTIELIGLQFEVDRIAIYKIDHNTDEIKELANWMKPESIAIANTIPIVHLSSQFKNSIELGTNRQEFLVSYIDKPHPILILDKIDNYLHVELGIKSLLWYPFAYTESGYYVLALNHLSKLQRFSTEEHQFLKSVTALLNIVLVNISSLEGLQNSIVYLEDSDAYNRMLFETTPISLALCNLDGVFIDVNNAFTQLFNVSKEEIVNKISYWDFRPGSEITSNRVHIEALKEPGDFYKFEKIFHDGNGNDIPILVHCAIISKDEDKFMWIALEDLTRQKRDAMKLSESEKRHLFITESVDNMIVYYDINGKVEYANKAMLDFMGMTSAEAMGANFTDFIHPDMREEVRSRLTIATENKIEKTMLFVDVISANNKISHLQVLSSSRIENGKLSGYMSTCVDITAKVEHERERDRTLQSEITTNKILAVANEDFPINDSLHRILDIILTGSILATTDKGAVFLLNPQNNTFEAAANINIKDINNKELEFFSPFNCICGGATKEKGKIKFSKPGDINPFYKGDEPNNFCCVPIVYQQNSLGILTLFLQKGYQPTEIECNFLIGISDILASMIMRKKVESEISNQNIMLQAILDNAPVGIWYLNKNRELVFANKVITDIVGLSLSEMSDKQNIIDTYDESSLASFFKNDEIAFSTDTPISSLEITKLKDGTTKYGEITKVRVMNANQQVDGLIGIAFDITEQVVSRQQIELQSAALEAAANGIMITDTERRVVWANPAFCRSFGYSLSEIQGFDSGFLISTELNQDLFQETARVLMNGLPWHGEVFSRRKDGTLFDQELTITPLVNREDKTTHFIAVHQDITERKAAYNTLIEAKKKAEEASEIKSNFLSNMSHELRTPLNGILGFSEILIDRLNDDKLRNFANNVYKSGKRLENTIEQIFELTNLSSVTANPIISRFNLNELCIEIIDRFREEAYIKSIVLESILQEYELYIDSDRLLLEKSLSKLIDNAIKYSDSGTITVSAGYTDFTSSHFFISVEDEGIGIPKDKHDIIFEEFRQVSEGKARSFEGVGLGLTVARQCIQTLGGEILLHSNQGSGSCFTIQVPLKREYTSFLRHHKEIGKHSNLEITDRDTMKLKRGKVLIVEDEEINQKYLEISLQFNYDYITTDNGNEAIRLAKENSFDIIFMDINLGKKSLDGLSTIQIIKRIPGYEMTPMIAVTAFASEQDKIEFLSNGFTHYLAKPFTKRDLLELLINL